MFRHCIGKALSCRSKCPPALPKAHRFSWRAGSGKGSFPAVSVGSSYTSPLLLYRYADNQSRENISLPLTKLFVCICPPQNCCLLRYRQRDKPSWPVPLLSLPGLRVFSLSMAVHPLSRRLCSTPRHHQTTRKSCEYPRCPCPSPCDLPCAS